MTAETAVAATGVVVLLGAVLSVGSVVTTQVRVTDAAGAGARAVARGEPAATVAEAVRRVGGPRVSVRTSGGGDLVRVTASTPVRLPLPGRPEVEVTASAVARLESAATELP